MPTKDTHIKTLAEELKGVKKRRDSEFKGRFTMTDVPHQLVNAFCSDIKSHYGNIYWVKLQDLMRKAEAYDAMVRGVAIPPIVVEPVEETGDKENKDEVQTMGGLRKDG